MGISTQTLKTKVVSLGYQWGASIPNGVKLLLDVKHLTALSDKFLNDINSIIATVFETWAFM